MTVANVDPYKLPAFSLQNRIARALWGFAWIILFRPTPKLMFAWRNILLRVFGSKIGKGCKIHQSAVIWAPWNLCCSDTVAIAAGVEIYNPSKITLGSHAIISQGAYLCGASHKYNESDFPLFSNPIIVGEFAWVCARACVLPGVTINDGAILGMSSVATKDLAAWTVNAGNPAKFVKLRSKTLENNNK